MEGKVCIPVSISEAAGQVEECPSDAATGRDFLNSLSKVGSRHMGDNRQLRVAKSGDRVPSGSATALHCSSGSISSHPQEQLQARLSGRHHQQYTLWVDD